MAGIAGTSAPNAEAVQRLREQVRGRVITAADEGYDEARMVHNGMFDRYPLAVLKAEQVGDVIGAVNLAREHELDLSVRCGGHSGPGFGTNDGGVVIDMSEMRTVRWIRGPRRPVPMPERRGGISTTQPTPSVWRRQAGSSRRRASPVSRWEEGSATWTARSGCRSTI